MATPLTITRVDEDAVTATATSITGTLAGLDGTEFLIAVCACDDQSEDIEVADGKAWTRVLLDANPAFTYAVFFYVGDGSLTGTQTFQFRRVDLTSDPFNLSLVAYRNVNLANPHGSNFTPLRVTSDTLNLTAILTEVPDVMVIALYGIPGSETVVTPPSGYTTVTESDGFQPGTAIYEKAQAVAGTTGTATLVISASATGLRGLLFCLRPSYGYAYRSGIVAVGTNVDNGGSAIAWSNPGNITADGSAATATAAATAASDYLTGQAPAFSSPVPAGSTLRGHEVVVNDRFRSGGTAGELRDNVVQLLDGSGTAVGSNKALTTLNWPPGSSIQTLARTYGQPDDLWSASLTVADVNDADRGVRIAMNGTTAGTDRVANVDFVRIIDYFTPPVYTGTGAAVVQFAGALTGVYVEPAAPDTAVQQLASGSSRDRTRYLEAEPWLRREEEPEREAEPEPVKETSTAPAPVKVSAPKFELPDPGEAELELQVALMLLGLLDQD